MVEAAKTTSQLAIDDGRLSQTKQLIDDLKSRLDVSEKLVAAEADRSTRFRSMKPTCDLLEAVAKYFGEEPTPTERVAHKQQ